MLRLFKKPNKGKNKAIPNPNNSQSKDQQYHLQLLYLNMLQDNTCLNTLRPKGYYYFVLLFLNMKDAITATKISKEWNRWIKKDSHLRVIFFPAVNQLNLTIQNGNK